jgi:hypothetical protein
MSTGNYTEYRISRTVYEDHDRKRETEHTFQSEDDNLNEILEQLTYFLLGCSFTYLKGLEAVRDDD